jgi:hypothetical protein
MRRDGPLTASPNAGRTMAAMAGALDVALEKRGHYRLGSGRDPDARDIDRALRVAGVAALLWLGAVAAVLSLGTAPLARRSVIPSTLVESGDAGNFLSRLGGAAYHEPSPPWAAIFVFGSGREPE